MTIQKAFEPAQIQKIAKMFFQQRDSGDSFYANYGYEIEEQINVSGEKTYVISKASSPGTAMTDLEMSEALNKIAKELVFVAAKENNPELLKSCFEAGVSTFQKDAQGNTPMFYAKQPSWRTETRANEDGTGTEEVQIPVPVNKSALIREIRKKDHGNDFRTLSIAVRDAYLGGKNDQEIQGIIDNFALRSDSIDLRGLTAANLTAFMRSIPQAQNGQAPDLAAQPIDDKARKIMLDPVTDDSSANTSLFYSHLFISCLDHERFIGEEENIRDICEEKATGLEGQAVFDKLTEQTGGKESFLGAYVKMRTRLAMHDEGLDYQTQWINFVGEVAEVIENEPRDTSAPAAPTKMLNALLGSKTPKGEYKVPTEHFSRGYASIAARSMHRDPSKTYLLTEEGEALNVLISPIRGDIDRRNVASLKAQKNAIKKNREFGDLSLFESISHPYSFADSRNEIDEPEFNENYGNNHIEEIVAPSISHGNTGLVTHLFEGDGGLLAHSVMVGKASEKNFPKGSDPKFALSVIRGVSLRDGTKEDLHCLASTGENGVSTNFIDDEEFARITKRSEELFKENLSALSAQTAIEAAVSLLTEARGRLWVGGEKDFGILSAIELIEQQDQRELDREEYTSKVLKGDARKSVFLSMPRGVVGERMEEMSSNLRMNLLGLMPTKDFMSLEWEDLNEREKERFILAGVEREARTFLEKPYLDRLNSIMTNDEIRGLEQEAGSKKKDLFYDIKWEDLSEAEQGEFTANQRDFLTRPYEGRLEFKASLTPEELEQLEQLEKPKTLKDLRSEDFAEYTLTWAQEKFLAEADKEKNRRDNNRLFAAERKEITETISSLNSLIRGVRIESQMGSDDAEEDQKLRKFRERFENFISNNGGKLCENKTLSEHAFGPILMRFDDADLEKLNKMAKGEWHDPRDIERAREMTARQMSAEIGGKIQESMKHTHDVIRLDQEDINNIVGATGAEPDFVNFLKSGFPQSPYKGISIIRPLNPNGSGSMMENAANVVFNGNSKHDTAYIALPGTDYCVRVSKITKQPEWVYHDGELRQENHPVGSVVIDTGVLFKKDSTGKQEVCPLKNISDPRVRHAYENCKISAVSVNDRGERVGAAVLCSAKTVSLQLNQRTSAKDVVFKDGESGPKYSKIFEGTDFSLVTEVNRVTPPPPPTSSTGVTPPTPPSGSGFEFGKILLKTTSGDYIEINQISLGGLPEAQSKELAKRFMSPEKAKIFNHTDPIQCLDLQTQIAKELESKKVSIIETDAGGKNPKRVEIFMKKEGAQTSFDNVENHQIAQEQAKAAFGKVGGSLFGTAAAGSANRGTWLSNMAGRLGGGGRGNTH